ncbi:MAG: GDSL-type esterase/lipase family protein, partial [Pseudolysinimonas sp.]
GNDVSYIGRIMLGSLPAPLSWLPAVRRARREFDTPAQTDAKFAELEQGMRTLIAEIRRRSPRAEIVLVEYLSLLPADVATPVGRFPRELADWARGTAARLAALTGSVGEELGCVVVPVAAASASHHAWSAEPWTRRLQFSRTQGAPYHPTPAGMRAVAELTKAAIA